MPSALAQTPTPSISEVPWRLQYYRWIDQLVLICRNVSPLEGRRQASQEVASLSVIDVLCRTMEGGSSSVRIIVFGWHNGES